MEEREYTLKPGKMTWVFLFRLRKQKKKMDVNNRTDENLKKKVYVCVGMRDDPLLCQENPYPWTLDARIWPEIPKLIYRCRHDSCLLWLQKWEKKNTCILITKERKEKYIYSIMSVPRTFAYTVLVSSRLNLFINQLRVLWQRRCVWCA